jgi:hypothetical protein
MLFILKLVLHPLLLITIMKNVFLFLLLMIVLPVLLPAFHTVAAQNTHDSAAATIQVPLGGNTWVHGHTGKQRLLTGNGIEDWDQKEVSFTTYVRISRPGTIQVKLRSKANQPCKVAMTIAAKKKTIAINQSGFQ